MGTTFSHEVSNIRDDNLLFPPEITEAILRHLSPRDKLASREVCHDWNFYLSSSGLENNFVVNLKYTDEPFQIILDSPLVQIPWTNFYLSSINLTRSSSLFWNNYSDFITSLHLEDCCIIPRNMENDEEFRMGCPNLKHLGLTNCKMYMMMGANFFNLPFILNLGNLESLDLSNNSYLNDSILFSLLLEIKSLQSLNLSNCPIAFMNAIFRRFYPGVQDPQTDLKKFSDNILTFQMLQLSFLSTPRASKMKELILSDTRMNPASLALISDPDIYRWESIVLNRCSEMSGASLLNFVQFQQFITKLELERAHVKNDHLNSMNFTKLKHLVLKDCQEFTDLTFLANVINLNHLDLTNCSKINYITGDLTRVCRLTVLRMSGLRLLQVFQEQNPILAAMRADIVQLKCLTELDLGNSGTLVNDELVQNIIQHLRQLRILKLCKSLITDDGLVGPTLDVLGDEAPPPTGYNLSRLEHLRVLSLANCLDLGEITWTSAIRFPNLISLDLARCSQMTRSGLRSIVKHCSNLEHLVLLECGIRDESLISEIRNMPRMRNLIV